MAKIPNPNPIEIPPVAKKTFDAQYVTEVSIYANPDKPWVLNIVGQPFNSDTKEVYEGERYVVQIKDIEDVAASDAVTAQAVLVITQALGRILFWAKKLGVQEVDSDFIKKVQEYEKVT